MKEIKMSNNNNEHQNFPSVCFLYIFIFIFILFYFPYKERVNAIMCAILVILFFLLLFSVAIRRIYVCGTNKIKAKKTLNVYEFLLHRRERLNLCFQKIQRKYIKKI